MTLPIMFKKPKAIIFGLIEDVYGLLLLKTHIKFSFLTKKLFPLPYKYKYIVEIHNFFLFDKK